MGVTACMHVKSLRSCPTLRHPMDCSPPGSSVHGILQVHVKSLWSCLTLHHPMDCSPPGSSVHGILQARILERVAMPFSRDLPHPGVKPESTTSPMLQTDYLPLSPWGRPMGVTRENWVLLWWAGSCSVKLSSNYPLMSGVALPPW